MKLNNFNKKHIIDFVFLFLIIILGFVYITESGLVPAGDTGSILFQEYKSEERFSTVSGSNASVSDITSIFPRRSYTAVITAAAPPSNPEPGKRTTTNSDIIYTGSSIKSENVIHHMFLDTSVNRPYEFTIGKTINNLTLVEEFDTYFILEDSEYIYKIMK